MNNPSRKKQSFRFRRSLMKQVFVRSLTLLLLVSTLFLMACKDKTSTTSTTLCASNPGTCQSVLEAKDFFLFNVGTWWVYEEETSHVRDSMYVTQSVNSTNSYFNVQVVSALTGYSYHYWPVYYGNITGCNETGTVMNKCLYVKLSKGKPMDLVGQSNIFFVNYLKGDFVYVPNVNFQNNQIQISEVYSSFTNHNEIYPKTVKIHELSSHQEGDQPTNTFYSQHVGIIRKELLDSNQVWNLVAYHIEQ
jgi:hypothetical protein